MASKGIEDIRSRKNLPVMYLTAIYRGYDTSSPVNGFLMVVLKEMMMSKRKTASMR